MFWDIIISSSALDFKRAFFMLDIGSIITDHDFEKLELALKEPNIFNALSILRKEILHSNFISYILNPAENHGLEDILLEKFLHT